MVSRAGPARASGGGLALWEGGPHGPARSARKGPSRGDERAERVGRGSSHERPISLAALCAALPACRAEFEALTSGKLPDNWEAALPTFKPEDKPLATRQHSNTMINALAPVLPGLVGGSADLAPSNLTLMKISGDFQKARAGRRRPRLAVCLGQGRTGRSRSGLVESTARSSAVAVV